MDREVALYETPVSWMMLMIYEIARLHDNCTWTLQERETIDNGNRES